MLKFETCPRMLPAIRGIYLIHNIVTDMKYVGSSNNVLVRTRGHANKLLAGKHANRYMQLAWDTDGPDAFRWALIEQIDDVPFLVIREAFYIEEFRSGFGDRGYNLVINPWTGSLADDVRRRMSESQKGRPSWNKGRPCLEHVKMASRLAHVGRIKSPQEIEKLKLAMLGPAHPHRGKKFSAETCEKLSRRVRSAGPMTGAGRFKGVNLDARTQTFMARIYVKGKQHFLGRYKTDVEAAHAYNIAASLNFGHGCFQNPIESAPILERRTILGRPALEISNVA